MEEKVVDENSVANATLQCFLAAHGLATITTIGPGAEVISHDDPFHWNGVELVICSTEPVGWSALSTTPVQIELTAHDLRLLFSGTAMADRVMGIAPEHRAQLVRHLGPELGHKRADALDNNTVTTHRLFVTPTWIDGPEPQ